MARVLNLTIEEKRAFSGKSQTEVNQLWMQYGKKYSFNWETIRTEDGKVWVDDLVTSEKEETRPDGLPMIPEVRVESTASTLPVSTALKKMEILVQQRDEIVVYLKNLKVTNHEQNQIARAAGGKAKTLISLVEDTVKANTLAERMTIENWNEAKKTIVDPIKDAVEDLKKTIKVFEDQIAQIQREEKAAAEEAARANQLQQQKVAEAQRNAIRQVDITIEGWQDYLTKPKKVLKEYSDKLNAWKPDPAKWGDAYEYLLKEVEKLKLKFEAALKKEEAPVDKEPEWKVDFEEYLKILGVKEADIPAKSEEYRARFGSYELAHGNRHALRDEYNKAMELQNKSLESNEKIKGRRRNLVHRIIDESLIPREYLVVDEKLIKAAMKANKDAAEDGTFTIPGVEFVEETKTVLRKGA